MFSNSMKVNYVQLASDPFNYTSSVKSITGRSILEDTRVKDYLLDLLGIESEEWEE